MKRSFILSCISVLVILLVSAGCGGASSPGSKPEVKPVVTVDVAPGTYDATQSVTLSCTTDSLAEIYYTIDGNDPTEESDLFSLPITVADDMTIKAFAISSAGVRGDIVSFIYTIDPEYVPTPVISPATTDITTETAVSITAEKGTIYYTIDNTTISSSSSAYGGTFVLSAGTHTVRAIAVYNGTVSETAVQVYSVTTPIIFTTETPVISASAASPYYATTTFSISCATSGAVITYRVDSGTSSTYSAPFSLTVGRHVIYATASSTGRLDSDEASITVDIEEEINGIRIHFENMSGWGTPQLYFYNAVPSTVTTTWAGAPTMTLEDSTHTCYVYTIEDATSAVVMFKDASGNQTPGSGQSGFTRTKEGWYYNNNGTYTWSDTNPWTAVIPVITATPVAKTYAVAQSVSLSGSNSDDIIYYTTNGNTPTTSSSVFSATSPITVSTSTVIKAFGVNRDGVSGEVYSFTYVIDPNTDVTAPVVTASVDPGQYTVATTVSFSASDNKSATTTVYYTSDGSDPTTSSSVYLQGDLSSAKTGSSFTVAMDESKTFKFLAVDAAGNSATFSFGYYVSVTQHRDFRDETVYFMMTDRFCDGNTSNNNIWGDEFLPSGSSAYDYSEDKTGVLSYYHGGDFDGIIKNLDYIQDMGFTAIWITPVVKQPEGRRINNDNNYSASAFHGYWAYDFDQIDPHLHSSGKDSDGWSDFDKLVAAVHAKGMKVMLDIVVNHGHPGDSVKGSSSKWADKWNKIIMDGQTWTYDQTTDPLVVSSNPLTGFFSYSGTGGAWLIDLLDFNGNGPAANSAMPHLKAVYKRFIDHGVDAFRIDTVAYMSHDNWVDFTSEMYNYAVSKGNPYFYMVGEAWTGDRNGTNNATGIIYGTKGANNFNMLDLHNSSMDFPGWLGNVFKGSAGFDDSNVARIFGTAGDQSGIYDPTYLGTFVDNHDVYRANGIFTEAQYKNNLNYIYLFRGIPIVYYGTEAMYSWSGAYASTNKEDVCARWMLGQVGIDYVKTNKPNMYKHLKMLNALRRNSEVLRKGAQTNLVMSGDEAVIKRVYNGSTLYAAMSKGAAYSYTVTGIDNGTYTKYTPDSTNGTYTASSITVSGGSATLDVPANSFVIIQK